MDLDDNAAEEAAADPCRIFLEWMPFALCMLRRHKVPQSVLCELFNDLLDKLGVRREFSVRTFLRERRARAKQQLVTLPMELVPGQPELHFVPLLSSIERTWGAMVESSMMGLDDLLLLSTGDRGAMGLGDLNSGEHFFTVERQLNAELLVDRPDFRPANVLDAVAEGWTFVLPLIMLLDSARTTTRASGTPLACELGCLSHMFRHLSQFRIVVCVVPKVSVDDVRAASLAPEGQQEGLGGQGGGGADQQAAAEVPEREGAAAAAAEEDVQATTDEGSSSSSGWGERSSDSSDSSDAGPRRRRSRRAEQQQQERVARARRRARAARAAQAQEQAERRALAQAARDERTGPRREAQRLSKAKGLAMQAAERAAPMMVTRHMMEQLEQRGGKLQLQWPGPDGQPIVLNFRPVLFCICGDNDQQTRLADMKIGHSVHSQTSYDRSHEPRDIERTDGQSVGDFYRKQRAHVNLNTFVFRQSWAWRTDIDLVGCRNSPSRQAVVHDLITNHFYPRAFVSFATPTMELMHTLLLNLGRMVYKVFVMTLVENNTLQLEAFAPGSGISRFNAEHVYQGIHMSRVVSALRSGSKPDADCCACFLMLAGLACTPAQFVLRGISTQEATRFAGCVRVACSAMSKLVGLLLQRSLTEVDVGAIALLRTETLHALTDLCLGYASNVNKTVMRVTLGNLYYIEQTLRLFGSLHSIDTRNNERWMQMIKCAMKVSSTRLSSLNEELVINMYMDAEFEVELRRRERQQEAAKRGAPLDGAHVLVLVTKRVANNPVSASTDAYVEELSQYAAQRYFDTWGRSRGSRSRPSAWDYGLQESDARELRFDHSSRVELRYSDGTRKWYAAYGATAARAGDNVRVEAEGGWAPSGPHYGAILSFVTVSFPQHLSEQFEHLFVPDQKPGTPLVMATVILYPKMTVWASAERTALLRAQLGDLQRGTYQWRSDPFKRRVSLKPLVLPTSRNAALTMIRDASHDTEGAPHLWMVPLSNLTSVLVARDEALHGMMQSLRQRQQLDEELSAEAQALLDLPSEVLTVAQDLISIPDR